jgi:predicted DCC family thiol-disulfide oxidoreductase YuxK
MISSIFNELLQSLSYDPKSFWIFFVALSLSFFAIKNSSNLTSWFSRFGTFLEAKSFPSQSTFEHNKFAILRILFGAVIAIRGWNNYSLLLTEEIFSPVGFWIILEGLVGVFIMLGCFTQWCLIFLVFLMWRYGERVVGTSTLGNDVGAFVAILFFTVNAGKFISVDAFVSRSCSVARQGLLYFPTIPDKRAIALAKFTALTSYWAICVHSVARHIAESSWMDGSAAPLLLSSNFMSRWSDLFTSLFESSALSVSIARLLLWIMMFWYPVVMPFVLLGRIPRTYVIIWGWLFIALSLFVLQLGYLAEIEVILWLGLFWSSIGISSKKSLEVFYDDKCDLCDRTIRTITYLDIFNRIILKPISENRELLNQYKIPYESALIDLHGVASKGRSMSFGYNFYIQLSKTTLLLWPAIPLLYLGKFTGIGPMCYRFIADRRRQLFGICSIPRQKFSREITTKRGGLAFSKTMTMCLIILLPFYFLATPAQFAGWNGRDNIGAEAIGIFGVQPIDVFNRSDLRMSENWFSIYSEDFEELVPVLDRDGKRLEMHRSDRIYFGNTLIYRRRSIGQQGCHWHTLGDNLKNTAKYLMRVYLKSRQAPPGEYWFVLDQYFQSNVTGREIRASRFEKVEKEIVCSISEDISITE